MHNREAFMGCTSRFLNFGWEHHHWRPRVSSAETLATHDTNMWGRVVHGKYVRCDKQEVCEECGRTREAMSCICDTSYAEHCGLLRAWEPSEERR